MIGCPWSVRRGGSDLGIHEPEPSEFFESEITKMKRVEIEVNRMKNLMSKSIGPLPVASRIADIAALLKVCRILAFAAAPALCFAQNPDLNLMNPETIGGPQPYSSVSTDTETVNNANGNLIVNVPLLHLPGINGLDLDLSVRYESKGPHIADPWYVVWGPGERPRGRARPGPSRSL
jgi:hypothetical protein